MPQKRGHWGRRETIYSFYQNIIYLPSRIRRRQRRWNDKGNRHFGCHKFSGDFSHFEFIGTIWVMSNEDFRGWKKKCQHTYLRWHFTMGSHKEKAEVCLICFTLAEFSNNLTGSEQFYVEIDWRDGYLSEFFQAFI